MDSYSKSFWGDGLEKNHESMMAMAGWVRGQLGGSLSLDPGN